MLDHPQINTLTLPRICSRDAQLIWEDNSRILMDMTSAPTPNTK